MSSVPPPSAPGAINQGSAALKPGDIDDCAAVATIYAMHMYDHGRPLPTIPEFRAAAGAPDKPGPTGMTISQVLRAANKLWPDITVNGGAFANWDTFNGFMSKGLRPASAQIRSGSLPPALQYGFKGLHQVCVFKVGSDWFVSNPLQKNGAPPDHIGAASLRQALYDFAHDGKVYAALFPVLQSATTGPTVADLEKQLAAEKQKTAALTSSNVTLTTAVTALTTKVAKLTAKIAAAQKELS